VENLLTALALILFIPILPECSLIKRAKRFTFTFAVSYAFFLIPLMLFDQLSSFNYYLVPLFALLIASSTDATSLGITAAAPLLVLLLDYPYFVALIPILEMQFLVLNSYLRNKITISSLNKPTDLTSSDAITRRHGDSETI
jgi:hypothetical protein